MLHRFLRHTLRFAFRFLYYEGSWSYDLVAWVVSLGRWKGWVRAALPYVRGTRVLEFGHGPGHLQAALMENPQLKVYGIDLSPNMNRQADRRLRRKGCLPALVNATGEGLPFAAASLDTIAATFPTEYFNSPPTLAEAYRVLTPGGRYVIIPAAWITGTTVPDRAAAWLFNVTGQAPDWEDRALEPFAAAGFDTRLEWVSANNSRILIVIAEKKF